MEQVRTAKLLLSTTPEIFLSTISAYTKAYNFACTTSWNENDTNGVSLHRKTYRTCREYLTADLTCSARTKAIESVKSVKALQKRENKIAKEEKRTPRIFSCPQSKQNSIRYNDKTFTVDFNKSIVSLQTLGKRAKVSFRMNDYFKRYINWKRCSAELFIEDNRVWLHISFSKTIESVPTTNQCIGIDRGIKKLAVCSNNLFFGGSHVKKVTDRYHKIRKELQKKKHSGKRHLVKLRYKENRFKRDVNHVISKKIVSSLNPGATIVLEDLDGIRERTIYNCKKQDRRQKSSWSYWQLQLFIEYKAFSKGINVVYVNPAYTSKRCSACQHVSDRNRTKQSIFKCCECGFQLNADLNASRNIVYIYVKHLDAIDRRETIGTCHPDGVSQRTLCSHVSSQELAG